MGALLSSNMENDSYRQLYETAGRWPAACRSKHKTSELKCLNKYIKILNTNSSKSKHNVYIIQQTVYSVRVIPKLNDFIS